MKKVIICLLLICMFITGCGKYSKDDLVKDLKRKINKNGSYQLTGILDVNNNDDNYKYLVNVSYLKGDYYKVVLTNKANNHTQVILKNKDGVYVLTPSLNKSFRFNSDWPYNNSQIYLLDAIINDISNDRKSTFRKKNNNYIVQTIVNYPNNSKLVKQKIVFSDKLKPKSVSVYNSDGVKVMTMKFNKINFNKKLSDKDFKIESIISSSNNEKVQESSSLDDVIYPLFVPSGTKLVKEDKITKENGERVIMNYDGEKSFLLVEETVDVFKEFTVIPTSGEPYQLMDSLGVITDNSLSWTSGGIEFYLVSDVMSQNEMIEIAQSITGLVSMK